MVLKPLTVHLLILELLLRLLSGVSETSNQKVQWDL